MKKIIAIFLTLILGAMGEVWAFSGVTVKVYRGNSSYSGDVICNIKDGVVYRKSSSYSGDILCRISRDGKLYKGNSTYSGDIVANIRDGKLYEKNSSYSGDIIINIRNNRVYNRKF